MFVTNKLKTVTNKGCKRDKAGVTRLARARLSFGKDVTAVTRDKPRDVTWFGRDSDTPALRPGRHHHAHIDRQALGVGA